MIERKSKRHHKSSKKEKENVNGDKSVEIVEWSDGDASIRARNAESKALKQLDEMNTSDSNESSELKKRKSANNGNLILVMISVRQSLEIGPYAWTCLSELAT